MDSKRDNEEKTDNKINLCLSLPAFNYFGFKDLLKIEEIEIDTLKDSFLNLFWNASKKIEICSPFIEWSGFFPYKEVLRRKANQGVKIRILTREANSTKKYAILKKINGVFKKKQIEIRNYFIKNTSNYLASSVHAKMIIIDNYHAYIGSGELRENSFEKNLELGVNISGKIVEEIQIIFDRIFSNSERVNFER